MSALNNVRKFYPNVIQVKDATKNLSIEVSPADAKSKAVRNHKECAFAIACKRNYIADAAIISIKTSYLIKDNIAYRYITPTSLAREITAFDRDSFFDPGEYHLQRPSKQQKLGARKPTGPKKGKLESKRKLHFTESIRESLKSIK